MIAALGSALVPLIGSFAAYLIGAPLLDRRAALADGIERLRHVRPGERVLALPALHHHHGRRHVPAPSSRRHGSMLMGITGLGVLMVLTYGNTVAGPLHRPHGRRLVAEQAPAAGPHGRRRSGSRCSCRASSTASPTSPPTTGPTPPSPAKATRWRGGCPTGARSSRSPSTTRSPGSGCASPSRWPRGQSSPQRLPPRLRGDGGPRVDGLHRTSDRVDQGRGGLKDARPGWERGVRSASPAASCPSYS